MFEGEVKDCTWGRETSTIHPRGGRRLRVFPKTKSFRDTNGVEVWERWGWGSVVRPWDRGPWDSCGSRQRTFSFTKTVLQRCGDRILTD